MAIQWLQSWAPFKIDALGLVTLLGSDEVNVAVGCLSRSRITEYLPLVGGFVVAGDKIRLPISGFALYNITDGICAIDITGWASRWLLSRGLTYNATTIIVSFGNAKFLASETGGRSATVLGATTLGAIVLLPILIRDWWGLANAMAIVVSVVVRAVVVKEIRDAVDRSAEKGMQQSNAMVKTFWKLPNGSTATIYAPRGIVTECLLSTPWPANARLYFSFRMLGWVAFLIHIVSLGMASLPNQLLTVSILGISTVCVALGVGIDNQWIGSRILIFRRDHSGQSSAMAAAYARLRLTPEEEDSMVAWRLMPQLRNEVWWRKYREYGLQNSLSVFENWKDRQTWHSYESLVLAEANLQSYPQSNGNTQETTSA